MRTPLEVIARYVYEQKLLKLAETLEVATGRKGLTPIEGLFFAAIHTVIEEDGALHFVGGLEPEVSQFAMASQVQIERFRVDYLVSVRAPGGIIKHMVVECDGHDFHERTKEQARKDRSRDRRLQELGYLVFRFTGSELYSDPIRCALSVYEWAYATACGRSQ